MKTCVKCLIVQPYENFYPKTKRCKECTKAAVKARYYEKHKEIMAYEKKRSGLPHRVLARDLYAKTPGGLEAGGRAKRKYSTQNPEKRAAHVLLGNRIRDGLVVKPTVCSVCNKGGRIEGHHDDYAKPLDVKWMCTQCHSDYHAVLDAKGDLSIA
jgi:hypothetical protein